MENPTEKLIENLLSVYLNAKPGEPLDLYAQSLLDQLVGPNSGENQKSTIKLFKQKLLDFENGNRNSAEYVKKVIVLTYYMFDIHNMDGRFFKYSSGVTNFYKQFQEEFFDFCKDNAVENWSNESLELIGGTIKSMSKYRAFVLSFDKFEELEKRLNSKGKYFDREVKERILDTAILEKTVQDKNPGFNPLFIREIAAIENYFLKYASCQLKKKSVDGIWNDDVINLVLQLRNAKRISEKAPNNPALKELNEAADDFCKRNFSEERIAELQSQLISFVGRYSLQKLDTPAEQAEFEEAYKMLYVYELVSGKQREITPYSNYFDLFLFRNISNFRNLSHATNINVERFALRAIQNTIVKEVRKELNEGKDKLDPPLIMRIERDFILHGGLAGAIIDYDLIDVSPEIICTEMHHKDFAGSVYHEMDHFTKAKKEEKEIVSSYDEYKVYKSYYGMKKDLSINAGNYENAYHEVNAYCISALAEIRLLRMFSVGENDAEIQKKIDAKIAEIKGYLKSTIDNKLQYYDENTRSWKSDTDVSVFDRVYKKVANKREAPIFDFEYHDDGTPKELFEIIMDQQRELETGELDPKCGPEEPTERAKLRFQIMMERAMETHQEKMCYLMIRDFVKMQKDEFRKDDLFKIDLPSGKKFTSFDFDTLITNLLKDGKKEGFQNALFLTRLQAMAERVKLKEDFRESVFSFYQDAFGLDGQNQDRKSGENHTDPIPE